MKGCFAGCKNFTGGEIKHVDGCPNARYTKRECIFCKNPITSKHKTVKFCSHKCANQYSAPQRQKKVEITCLQCNKVFIVTPGDLKYRKEIKFCSRKCANIYSQKRVIIKCHLCGKEFEKLTCRIEKSQFSFCSDKCAKEHIKANPVSKKYKNWSEFIKERMNNESVKTKLSLLNSRERRPMSEDHKNNISNKLKGIMPKNLSDNRFSIYKRGTYDINGKLLFFRSCWEANYALYLDFLIKTNEIEGWEYEPTIFYFEKIKRGIRSYTPDFKIKLHNGFEWHEVKGYMDDKSQTKIKRMAIYYPAEVLKVIEKTQYKEIIKKLSGIINFYS
jgi:hypothetical protein